MTPEPKYLPLFYLILALFLIGVGLYFTLI